MTDTESDAPLPPEPEIEPPHVSSWLLSFLSERRDEYEEQFGTPAADDELVTAAIDRFERHASQLVTTGVLPGELGDVLADYSPGDPVDVKVRKLLLYTVVHHRIEFDVAEEVCANLKDIDNRVAWLALATLILMGYRPTITAEKYFQRATKLFLAGYTTETVIMCGAVLEAALASRFPNAVLEEAGLKPAYHHSRDYSIGQRLKFEERHQVFDDEQRQLARDVINWRNDAVHVQPDIGPDPKRALLDLAILLPVLLRTA